MEEAAEASSYLPDELWERILIKLLNGGDNHQSYLKSLSAVSKQLLSITNPLGFSITITDETIPFVPRLFQRFPNLKSLNFNLVSSKTFQFNKLLTQISTFPNLSHIKSLSLASPKALFLKRGCLLCPKSSKII